mgnify:CR=1 FL=1
MSAPLPDALRAQFQKLIEEGLSGRAVALGLKLSPASLGTMMQPSAREEHRPSSQVSPPIP